MANNGGDNYTISTAYKDLDVNAFKLALNTVIAQEAQPYHIASYNCTTAATSVCDAAGLTIGKNESFFPLFTMQGQSPGRLGLDLRNHQTSGEINPSGGKAPQSKGPCN